MPIVSDCHMHTMHSGDSATPMEEMILKGISQGLTTICFTVHNDYGFPITDLEFGEVGKHEFEEVNRHGIL